MRANPGGHIQPAEVLGRDLLIENIWHVLKGQSVIITAERRMGKTSTIKKMIAQGSNKNTHITLNIRNEKNLIYRDLENVRSPLEFVDKVYQDIETYLSTLQKTAGKVRKLLESLRGAEVTGIKIPDLQPQHWKTILTNIMEDLTEHSTDHIYFFWDELPMMIDNIKADHGEKMAMDILDTLRQLRNQYPNNLRMIYTGSIGLHHVIKQLKKKHYVNDPTNDMQTIDLPPLSDEDAKILANLLLKGDGIKTDHLEEVGEIIAINVDNIPFYIHKTIFALKMSYELKDKIVNKTIVKQYIDHCLVDLQDPWHLSHYYDRIETYYEENERPFVKIILDILTVTDQVLSFNEIFNLIKAKVSTNDEEFIRSILELMAKDHYIIKNIDRKFQFRFPLIKRYWTIKRDL